MSTATDQWTEDGHATDGAVVAMLDGEPLADAALLRAHVERCARCGARRAALGAMSASVGSLLPEGTPPDAARTRALRERLVAHERARPGSRWRRPALRAAAAVVIVTGLAGIAGATPAGRRLLHAVRDRVVGHSPSAPSATARAPVPSPAATASAPRELARVRFAPGAGALHVVVAQAQRAGTMEIRRVDDTLATVRVLGGDAAPEIVVSPGVLRIENAAPDGQSYELLVPRALRLVVTIGGVEVPAAMVASGRVRVE
jgi:hypothetical protein